MKISKLSKVLLLLSAVALIVSLFVPIWRIYLDAPQYPEGLSLQIWANSLAGDVEIINGLNHYIGMKTLHTDDFIEFTVLPYIIVAFAILFVLASIIARKKLLYIAFWSFVAFGIIAMVDFWKWEYDYGHNLDPNAAIIVPGMAYQPPLIGFKQLLNFGAFSIPDIGGWLFVSAGILLLIAVLMESRFLQKFKKKNAGALTLLALSFFLLSCGNTTVEPILLNKDACASCKMSIAEGRFATELITQKGRIYKFDDIICMIGYMKENTSTEFEKIYVGDYTKENELIDATTAWFVQSEFINSPMGGHTAAFIDKTVAEKTATENQTKVATWNEIKDSSSQEQHHSEHHH